MELSAEDIEETKTILVTEGTYLTDTCIQMSLMALDTKEAQEKFLIINEINRQLPFNRKPENIERLSRKLGLFMKSKFRPTQEAIILIYNRPEEYLDERDKILRGAIRPHWFTICITFHNSASFKIKVIDSYYRDKNMAQKKNIIEESKMYLSCLIKNFLLLKHPSSSIPQDIQLKESDINLIGSKKQKDGHSCGDFSIEAVRSIIENQTWVKPGKNIDQRKLHQLDITSTRWRIRNIIDGFQMGLRAQKKDLEEEIAEKYDLEKILKSSDSAVITDCADTSNIIDVVNEVPLFKKRKANTRVEELRISERYEKYLLSYISQIKKSSEKGIIKKRRYRQ